MNKIITDFSAQISERIKSIYGGTFVIVWMLVNWKVIYYLTYLGKYRFWVLNTITKYIDSDNFCSMLIWKPAFLTLISILIYGVFNTTAVGILSLFSLKIKPWVIKKIQEGSIVEYSDFRLLQDAYDDLEAKSKQSVTLFRNLEIQRLNDNKKAHEEKLLKEKKINSLEESTGYLSLFLVNFYTKIGGHKDWHVISDRERLEILPLEAYKLKNGEFNRDPNSDLSVRYASIHFLKSFNWDRIYLASNENQQGFTVRLMKVGNSYIGLNQNSDIFHFKKVNQNAYPQDAG